MSDETHFMRAKTLSMKTTRSTSQDEVIKRVMRHNLREVQAEFGERSDSTIDPRRFHLNERLFGVDTADGVAHEAQEVMRAAQITPRANAALGIEIVFGLPSGLQIDYRAYFIAAMQWAQRFFDVPMLSAIQHADEDHPHAHVVMLPLRDGKLIGRDILGGRAETVAMHKSFHLEVGKRYGLSLPKPQARHSADMRHVAMQIARDYLRGVSALTDAVVDALLTPHRANPEPMLRALGLAMPTEPSKTMAGIFTRDCGRETAIAVFDKQNIRPKNEQNQNRYALIAVSNLPPFSSPPDDAQPTTCHPTSASKSTAITPAGTTTPDQRADHQHANAGPFAPIRKISSAPRIPMQLGCQAPKYPKQLTSARADVLAAWLSSDDPAGIEGIQGRLGLAIVVRALVRKYHWRVERRDIKTSIGDGRTAWASVYCLPPEGIEAALSAGGHEWLEGYRAEQATRATRQPSPAQGQRRDGADSAEPVRARRGQPPKRAS